MPRTIRLDDFDDPIIQHALVRFALRQALPEADGITAAVIREALLALRPTITNAIDRALETGAAIDAALAAPPTSSIQPPGA